MKLLEIKNNLVKLSYSEAGIPILGRFIVLVTPAKSYVAQFVNLKSDSVNNFAIAKCANDLKAWSNNPTEFFVALPFSANG